jgi:PIN like domain
LPLEQLQIVLDENLPWSIAAELRNRGFTATSNYALNASGLKDPEWLEIVANLSPAAVLVTYDNAMPLEHEAWLTHLAVTLAVVDSARRPIVLTAEQYWRDVIHRHAHQFASQDPGSWWRYRRLGRRRIQARGR